MKFGEDGILIGSVRMAGRGCRSCVCGAVQDAVAKRLKEDRHGTYRLYGADYEQYNGRCHCDSDEVCSMCEDENPMDEGSGGESPCWSMEETESDEEMSWSEGAQRSKDEAGLQEEIGWGLYSGWKEAIEWMKKK